MPNPFAYIARRNEEIFYLVEKIRQRRRKRWTEYDFSSL
jgi:hypothetical protein